jgi:tetraacyldisaccharide-1-P 4'-kinase
LPRGYLRDSPRRLPQADALFFYGKDFKMRVERILNLQGEEIASIKGWRVALFSAIAKPGRFKKTVIDLGAEVISERIFRDHALIPLDQLTRWAKQSGAKALLCTEKDAVKLPPSFDAGVPILFLEIEMEILCHRVSWENLIAKIDQKIDNHAPICKKK